MMIRKNVIDLDVSSMGYEKLYIKENLSDLLCNGPKEASIIEGRRVLCNELS